MKFGPSRTLSGTIAFYFGSLFALSSAAVFYFWYVGAPGIGLIGAGQQYISTATGLLEQAVNFERRHIDNQLRERRGDILVVAENRVLAGLLDHPEHRLQDDFDRVATRLERAYPDKFKKLLIVAPDTLRIRASTEAGEIGRIFPMPEFIRRAGETGATELLEQFTGVQDEPLLVIARQIHAAEQRADGNPRLVGILIAYVDLGHFLGNSPDIFSSEAANSYTVLQDSTGNIIARSYAANTIDDSFLRSQQIADGFEGTLIHHNKRGTEVIAVHRHIRLNPTRGWQLVQFQEVDEVLAALRESSNRLTGIGLLLSLVSLLLIWFAARRIAQPLQDINTAAQHLGAGELASRATVDADECVEFTQLASSFNAMAGNIENAQHTLEQRVAERTAELYAERSAAQRYLDVAAVMIMALDAQGRITLINDKGCEILGKPEAELLGCNWFSTFLPGEIRAEVGTLFTRLMNGEREPAKYYENEIIDGNGQRRTMAWHNALLHDADGRISGTLSSAEDITERKRVEDSLVRERGHMKTLINTIPDLVWLKDPDGVYLGCNARFERFFGSPETDILGKTDHDFVPADLADFFREHDRKAMRAGGPSVNEEWITYADDGHRELLETTKVPMYDERHGLIGVLGIGHDITERKRVEQELEQHRQHLEQLVEQRTADLIVARDTAEAASRAKSTFLSNMSHELRTPMNAIIGMTALARRQAADPKLENQLLKIDQASHHLLNVINDILDISKIEAERLHLENTPFRLGAVLENLSSLLGQRAADKGLSLVVEIAPELAEQALSGDPLRIGQILINLVGNAIKFTEHGGVTLRIARTDCSGGRHTLRFEIADTGIGIAPADQARLFSAFEQADNSMTRRYGGTGLGLAISKRLAQLMGGDIGISSAPGLGSTFWFTLRLAEAPADVSRVVPGSVDDDGGEARLREAYAGRHILLAEDEPVNREIALSLLQWAGLHVDQAEDGRQALHYAQSRPYDLILMDMQMPHLNGVDATQAIRRDSLNRATPILAMTANAFAEDRRICLEAGMNDHLSKPIKPEQLFAMLLNWLDKARD